MAKNSSQHSKHVNNMIKVGSPRPFKKTKGNAPAKTSRKGNGKRLR